MSLREALDALAAGAPPAAGARRAAPRPPPLLHFADADPKGPDPKEQHPASSSRSARIVIGVMAVGLMLLFFVALNSFSAFGGEAPKTAAAPAMHHHHLSYIPPTGSTAPVAAGAPRAAPTGDPARTTALGFAMPTAAELADKQFDTWEAFLNGTAATATVDLDLFADGDDTLVALP